MKLGTLRVADEAAPDQGTTFGHTAAVRFEGDTVIEIAGVPDVGVLLADPDWRSVALSAGGREWKLADIEQGRWAPVVPAPGKIFCAGLNYREHILEMGRKLPEYPTLFAKYPEALVGAYDDVELPSVSNQVDWEGELAVIIGKRARRVAEDVAGDYIAGYAILNDVSMRDYQHRTLQWLQGKTFENSTPFGPFLVTADEWEPGPALRTVVDGEVVQEASTGDLVFSPEVLVSYISQIVTLKPGDVIASGTPGGVGHARKPARYLQAGSTLATSIEGLGAQENRMLAGL
jgi:acylpyruvate hydrolase